MREVEGRHDEPWAIDTDHPLQCSMGWVSYVQTLCQCTAACAMKKLAEGAGGFVSVLGGRGHAEVEDRRSMATRGSGGSSSNRTRRSRTRTRRRKKTWEEEKEVVVVLRCGRNPDLPWNGERAGAGRDNPCSAAVEGRRDEDQHLGTYLDSTVLYRI